MNLSNSSLAVAAIFFALTATVCSATDQVVTNCSNDTDLRNKLVAIQTSGGGTLTFGCGSSPTIIVMNGSALPDITATTTVDGGSKITISAGNASNIFRNEVGISFTLKNITLTKGFYSGNGAAVTALGPFHAINVKFIDNHAVTGGAVYAVDSAEIQDSEFALNTSTGTGGAAVNLFGFFGQVFSITNSLFRNNETGLGSGFGGAVLVGQAQLSIAGSTFLQNRANRGGGVYVDIDSSANIISSTFEGNWGASGGGGIYNLNALTLTASTLKDNQTGNGAGGGLANVSQSDGIGNASAQLSNVTFSGNSSGIYGGAILNSHSRMDLQNCTLSGNSAGSGGAAIFHHSVYAGRQVTLTNTVVANSVSGQNCAVLAGPTSIVSLGFDLSDDFSCAFGGGRDNVNPMLGGLSDNGGPTLTFLPLAGSPLLDEGTIVGCAGTDQRGITRPQGPACDIGAVEVALSTPTPIPTIAPTAPTIAPTAPSAPLNVDVARTFISEIRALVSTAKRTLPAKPSKFLSKAKQAKIKAQRKVILSARSTVKSDIAGLVNLEASAGIEIRTSIANFSKSNLESLRKNATRAISNNEKHPMDAKKFWKQVKKILVLLN